MIIGGRYGSTTAEGVSYTEKEYEYAVKRGMCVLSFVHSQPDEIPMGKSETDPIARDRLVAFREKIMQGRMVEHWSKAEELPGLVALSLLHAIKAHPATGWVRADQVANVAALGELNELRKQKEEFKPNWSAQVGNPSLKAWQGSVRERNCRARLGGARLEVGQPCSSCGLLRRGRTADRPRHSEIPIPSFLPGPTQLDCSGEK
jgi:hypothetical protein